MSDHKNRNSKGDSPSGMYQVRITLDDRGIQAHVTEFVELEVVK